MWSVGDAHLFESQWHLIIHLPLFHNLFNHLVSQVATQIPPVLGNLLLGPFTPRPLLDKAHRPAHVPPGPKGHLVPRNMAKHPLANEPGLGCYVWDSGLKRCRPFEFSIWHFEGWFGDPPIAPAIMSLGLRFEVFGSRGVPPGLLPASTSNIPGESMVSLYPPGIAYLSASVLFRRSNSSAMLDPL